MQADLSGYGDVAFTTVYVQEADGRPPGVYCDRADPRVRISPVLIREWHETKAPDGNGGYQAITLGQMGASVLLDCTGKDECPAGDVVTFACANRKLVYVITGSEPAWMEGNEPVTYLAEWPGAAQ